MQSMKLLTIIAALTLFSCGTKRYLTESVYSKEIPIEAKVVKISRCARGWHHLMVTPKDSTLVRHYNERLNIDSCYQIYKLN